MKKSVKTIFFVKKKRVNDNETQSLMCRVIIDGKRKQFACNIDVPQRLWEANNCCAKGNSIEAVKINTAIERIRSNVERYYCEHIHTGVPIQINEIIAVIHKYNDKDSLFNFMESNITLLRQMGKIRTAESYRATLRSFMQFRDGEDILLNEISSELMQIYEAYLHNKGVTRNSSSFYMRIMRAVYNRAVENNLTFNRTPFKHVYTGIDKTTKRAITLNCIKQIKSLDLTLHPSLDFARDIFLFSFYTRGMSFIDIAYLKKKELSNGILSYRRRKTGQQLFIRWEKCMQDIVDKHNSLDTEYLLPIIKPTKGDERKQYQNAMYLINRKLKIVGKIAGIETPLTMYVARHSWASAAKNKNVPISVISEGMGHDSEATTQIYLASLDTAVVDKANSMILNSL